MHANSNVLFQFYFRYESRESTLKSWNNLLLGFISVSFQFLAERMLHCKFRYSHKNVVCRLSVCRLSVTRVYCDKTAEARIMQFLTKM